MKYYLLLFIFIPLFFSPAYAKKPSHYQCPDIKADLWFANDESGSVDSIEFNNSLDFLYQISDQFIYDDKNGVKAGIISWNDSVVATNILIPISDTFGDAGDSGLKQTGNLFTNNNKKGLRELYKTRKLTGGTRLDYATMHLAKIIPIPAYGGRKDVKQISVFLTDAADSQLVSGSAGWINAANKINGTIDEQRSIILILIADAATAYRTNNHVKNTIDQVVGRGLLLLVDNYYDAARASAGYIDQVVDAICKIAKDEKDWGDAPDSYGTDNIIGNHGKDLKGPYHYIVKGIHLGKKAPDKEKQGKPSVKADADGKEEDGIKHFPKIKPSDTTYTIPLSSISATNHLSKTATIKGFIDFNRNGHFNDKGESSISYVLSGQSHPTTDLVFKDFINSPKPGKTYARFRISTENTLSPNSPATDGEVEDYLLSIGFGFCKATSGEVSEVNLTIKNKIQKNDRLIMASTNIDQQTGHLKAYRLNEKGQPASQALWDAAQLMTATQRKALLYSTQQSNYQKPKNHPNEQANTNAFKQILNFISGNKHPLEDNDKEHPKQKNRNQLTLIKDLNYQAFDVSHPSIATHIKNYTIDPSYKKGAYLFGRQKGSFLGPLSRGNNALLVDNKPNYKLYAHSPNYRDYSKKILSKRSTHILLTSDDGFLYNIDYQTGSLQWGWMPESITKQLKDYAVFQSQQLMAGALSVKDAKDLQGKYASYIIGSYQSGLGHYVLRYNTHDNKGRIDQVISDTNYSDEYTSGVSQGEKAFFQDNSGQTYMVYALIDHNNQSVIKIQSISNPSVNYTIHLKETLSSKPFIVSNYQTRYAPKAHWLYWGTHNGQVLAAPLLSSTGTINSKKSIQSSLSKHLITTMETDDSEGISYLSIVRMNANYYLLTQTRKRLTVHQYQSKIQQWKPLWTTTANSAGTWNANNHYQENKKSTQSNLQGHPIIPPKATQALPKGAIISGKVSISSGNIVVPVTLETEPQCSAYYYFFALNDGSFPNDAIFNRSKQPLDHNMVLGSGAASTMALSYPPNQEQALGYSNVDQNRDQSTTPPKALTLINKNSMSMKSWKIIQ